MPRTGTLLFLTQVCFWLCEAASWCEWQPATCATVRADSQVCKAVSFRDCNCPPPYVRNGTRDDYCVGQNHKKAVLNTVEYGNVLTSCIDRHGGCPRMTLVRGTTGTEPWCPWSSWTQQAQNPCSSTRVRICECPRKRSQALCGSYFQVERQNLADCRSKPIMKLPCTWSRWSPPCKKCETTKKRYIQTKITPDGKVCESSARRKQEKNCESEILHLYSCSSSKMNDSLAITESSKVPCVWSLWAPACEKCESKTKRYLQRKVTPSGELCEAHAVRRRKRYCRLEMFQSCPFRLYDSDGRSPERNETINYERITSLTAYNLIWVLVSLVIIAGVSRMCWVNRHHFVDLQGATLCERLCPCPQQATSRQETSSRLTIDDPPDYMEAVGLARPETEGHYLPKYSDVVRHPSLYSLK